MALLLITWLDHKIYLMMHALKMIELGKLQDRVHRCTFHRRSVAYSASHTARACLWHMRLRHAPLPQNKSTPCSSSIYDHLHIFWFLMFIITLSLEIRNFLVRSVGYSLVILVAKKDIKYMI